MTAPGDTYERELKALLAGDKRAVERMVKTCNAMETAAYNTMLLEPFLVIRAAGSLGVDLVALRWDFSFPIEVKSSSDPVMHFSKSQRLVEQADTMLGECKRCHLVPRLPPEGVPRRSVEGLHHPHGPPVQGEALGPVQEAAEAGRVQQRELHNEVGGRHEAVGLPALHRDVRLLQHGLSGTAVRTHRAHHGSASVNHHPVPVPGRRCLGCSYQLGWSEKEAA